MNSDLPTLAINYTASRTGAKFHACNDFVRGIMGSYGSGKSSCCCVEIFHRAMQQSPGEDDYRHTRWAVIRSTYPELTSTTIKTWLEWFPPEICQMKYKAPIEGHIRIPPEAMPDGIGLDMEILFLALDRPQDIKKLKSMEVTGVWINEAVELPKAVLDAATGRVGRYPNKKHLGFCDWCGVLMDTNPCDDDHWYYKLAEVEKPIVTLPDGSIRKYTFFRQPPALLESNNEWIPNPKAENIDHLPGGYNYYYQQLLGKTREWIRVFIQGEYGAIVDGKPVFPEYMDDLHYVDAEIPVLRGLPLWAGWDFGLTPAVAFAQLHPNGCLNVIDELVSDGMGLEQFIQQVVRPHIENHYYGMIINSYGGGEAAIRSQTDESTCLEILSKYGIPTQVTPTNSFLPRRESVASLLIRQKGLKLSNKAKILRKGFLGKYYYKRVQIIGEERYKNEPCKNIYSHIQDALQAICLLITRGSDPDNFTESATPHAKPVVTPNMGAWG